MLADLRTDADLARRDRTLLDRLDEANYAKSRITDEDAAHSGDRPYIYGLACVKLYGAAFRDDGIDIDRLEPAAAAALIRKRTIWPQIVFALDDWYQFDPVDERAGRLLEIANFVDEDAVRKHIRAAIGRKDRALLLQIADGPEADSLSPQTALLLAAGLESPKDTNDSARVAERALRRFPGDFWLNDLAGLYFQYADPPRTLEAVGAFQSALAVRPDIDMVLTNLSLTWAALGERDRALEVLSRAMRGRSLYFMNRESQIDLLLEKADWAGAEAAGCAGLRDAPQSCPARSKLVGVLSQLGRAEEAGRVMDEALALPRRTLIDSRCLGIALSNLNRDREAVSHFREIVKAAAGNGEFLSMLGMALIKSGQTEEGMTDLQKGVERSPRSALCHNLLALTLAAQGQWDEAIAADRTAIDRCALRRLQSEHLRRPPEAGRTTPGGAGRQRRGGPAQPQECRSVVPAGPLPRGIGLACRRDRLVPGSHPAPALAGLLPRGSRQGRDATKGSSRGDRGSHRGGSPGTRLRPVPQYAGKRLLRAEGLPQGHRRVSPGRRLERQGPDLSDQPGEHAPPDREQDRGVRALPQGDRGRSGGRHDPPEPLYGSGRGTAIRRGHRRRSGRRAAAPADPACHAMLGLALIRKGQPEKGQEELRKAIALDPRNSYWPLTLAENLVVTGKTAEAVAMAQAVVRLDPTSASSHDRLGTILHEARRYPEAVDALREATRLDPKSAVYLYHLAGSLHALGQPARDEALAVSRKMVALAPDQPECLARLASILVARGDDREAEATFQKAIELPQPNGNALDTYAQFLISRKRYGAAEAAFDRAIALAPGITTHRFGLVRCYQDTKQWGKAVEAQEAVVRLIPNDAAAVRTLGVCLRRAGRPADAPGLV